MSLRIAPDLAFGLGLGLECWGDDGFAFDSIKPPEDSAITIGGRFTCGVADTGDCERMEASVIRARGSEEMGSGLACS